jgi:lipopolysaccharide transport system ATP-binding protein
VDEVLAVGDAEFQKKCLGKMDEVSKGEGRTILFVSHNLAAVSQLCKRGVLLKQGELVGIGQSEDIISSYISQTKVGINNGASLINLDLRKGSGQFKVERIRMVNDLGLPIIIARTGSELIFEIQFNRTIRLNEGSFRIDFAIDTEQDMRVGWFSSDAVVSKLKKEFKIVSLKIPKFIFGSGKYYLTFYITLNGIVVDYIHQGFPFEVEEGDFFNTGKTIPKSQTFIYTEHQIFSN